MALIRVCLCGSCAVKVSNVKLHRNWKRASKLDQEDSSSVSFRLSLCEITSGYNAAKHMRDGRRGNWPCSCRHVLCSKCTLNPPAVDFDLNFGMKLPVDPTYRPVLKVSLASKQSSAIASDNSGAMRPLVKEDGVNLNHNALRPAELIIM